ncbi:hypothetical protein BGZ73_002074 [Actinomortierella ambigua]|nr:hypothetical protein BGZ73_002074 [Actinomortierella ambigua]
MTAILPASTFSPRSTPDAAKACGKKWRRSQGQGSEEDHCDHGREEFKVEVRFQLLYLKVHGLAATSRAILAISGLPWESIYPSDWANTEKAQTPFGTMPVLYETHTTTITTSVDTSRPTATTTTSTSATSTAAAAGEGSESSSSCSPRTTTRTTTVQIPESEVIEQYLARKFGLLGQDPWEEVAVLSFYASTKNVMQMYVSKVLTGHLGSEAKAQELRWFVDQDLPAWIALHERWLAENGTNGHYVGDQLSLADIRTAVSVERYMMIPEARDLFSAEKTPGLWAVKQTLDSHERYAAWRASDEYAAIDAWSKHRQTVLSK